MVAAVPTPIHCRPVVDHLTLDPQLGDCRWNVRLLRVIMPISVVGLTMVSKLRFPHAGHFDAVSAPAYCCGPPGSGSRPVRGSAGAVLGCRAHTPAGADSRNTRACLRTRDLDLRTSSTAPRIGFCRTPSIGVTRGVEAPVAPGRLGAASSIVAVDRTKATTAPRATQSLGCIAAACPSTARPNCAPNACAIRHSEDPKPDRRSMCSPTPPRSPSDHWSMWGNRSGHR